MADLTGAVVFIVEDEPIIAYDLRLTLEEAGAEVVGPALDLAQAQALASSEMSVALLDVRLGDHDVFAVAARLWDRGIPLVFHTGHASVDTLLSRWPGSRVLAKPVRSDVLLSTIARMLSCAGKGGAAGAASGCK
jgi:DNA-binding NtrC family response regulator